MSILETTAIARYLNDVLPGKSLVPATPKDRARMDMIVGVIDSYGSSPISSAVRTKRCEKRASRMAAKSSTSR
jgi:glutathione S-transferase